MTPAEREADTPPLGLTIGDRVALENRIDAFEARMEQHITEQKKRADDFYQHRMLPLEAREARGAVRQWVALGVCGATFLIVLMLLAEFVLVRK